VSHLAALRAEGAALAAAARAAGLDARVPSCPDWDVAGLLRHTAYGYRWVTHILRERRTTELPYEEVPPAPPNDPFDEYDRTLGELVDALADAGDATVWTWWPPDQTAAFWARRMAHETSVHRWDAQLAQGDPRPVATDRAVDGIDESLTVFVGDYLRGQPQEGLRGTAAVTATDTGDTWHLTLRPDGVDVTREAAPADATVRGPASDLWLALWGRGTSVETAGDERIVQLLTE
jgi:uncharacterized protein (TIGR03083 family)